MGEGGAHGPGDGQPDDRQRLRLGDLDRGGDGVRRRRTGHAHPPVRGSAHARDDVASGARQPAQSGLRVRLARARDLGQGQEVPRQGAGAEGRADGAERHQGHDHRLRRTAHGRRQEEGVDL